jgi:peptidyl-prolyl cis-trans isomerase D
MAMLQSIRDRTQGWIAGIIISLVILSFALWGIHSYMVGSANTDVIAKVNGVEISKRQLSAAFERLRRQVQSNMGSGSMPDSMETDLKNRALDALITVQVLKQGAADEDYKISPRQVDNYLESMPEFQVNGQFSTTRFQQLISTTMYTPVDFLNLIETTLLVDQPRLGIILSSVALPNEIDNSLALINQERDIQFLELPLDYFLKQNIPVSDIDVAAYYKDHQDQFKTPERVSVDYLELSLKDIEAGIHPTDDILTSFYNDNVNTYTQPAQYNLNKILIPIPDAPTDAQVTDAQNKARDVLEKLASGTDFAALAQQYPAPDSNSKTPTWVTVLQLPMELQKPVADLTKEGQTSDPIRISAGYVIVKAVGIKQPQVQTFEQVKDKVKDALIKQQAEEKFVEMKDKLANIAYEHPDTLDPAAKELGLSVLTTPLFSPDKGVSGDISDSKKVRDAAFSDDVLHSQNNSDVIQLSPEAVVVIRDKTHEAASLQPIGDVRQQVSEALQKKVAENKMVAMANDIVKQIKSGTPADQVAQQYNLIWDKVGYIGRYSTKIDSSILYTAFRLPKPEAGKGASMATAKLPNGYAVVAVNGVHDGATADNKEQYDVFDEQMQNSLGMLEYKLYQNSLKSKMKIVNYADNKS